MRLLRAFRTARLLLRLGLALVLLGSAPAAASANDDNWKLWIAFLGTITRWAPLSTHDTEIQCRRRLDMMYEIAAKDWLKAKAKGSLEEFEFHIYRCFPGGSPPGPALDQR
jgi:hypothetical protein